MRQWWNIVRTGLSCLYELVGWYGIVNRWCKNTYDSSVNVYMFKTKNKQSRELETVTCLVFVTNICLFISQGYMLLKKTSGQSFFVLSNIIIVYYLHCDHSANFIKIHIPKNVIRTTWTAETVDFGKLIKRIKRLAQIN